MLWFYTRHDAVLQVETRYAADSADFELEIVRPDRPTSLERFTTVDALQVRLLDLESEIQGDRWTLVSTVSHPERVKPPHARRKNLSSAGSPTKVTLLTCSDCVNDAILRRHLHDAMCALGWRPIFEVVDVTTLPSTDPRLAYPRPTVLWRGQDLFGLPEPPAPYPPPT